MSRPAKRELALKAVLYRAFVILYELLLAAIVSYAGWKLLNSESLTFVLVNNTIKLVGYFMWEMIWFGYVRTRLNLLRRVLKV